MHRLSPSYSLSPRITADTADRLFVGVYALLSIVLLALLANWVESKQITVWPSKIERSTSDTFNAFGHIWPPAHLYKKPQPQSTAIYSVALQEWRNNKLHIRPSGCIESVFINNHMVDLSGVALHERCDARSAVKLKVPWRVQSDNAVVTVYMSAHNERALDIFYRDTVSLWFFAGACLFFFMVGTYYAMRRDVPMLLLHMGLLAFALCLWYFVHVKPVGSGEDVRHHIIYIKHMAEHFRIPNPRGGYLFYHPPLYYYITGHIFNAAQWLGALQPLFAVRAFSLLLYAVFIGYGLFAIWRLNRLHPAIKLVGCGLLLYWPMGTMASSWVDNNLLWYALGAACYVHLLIWQATLKTNHLCIALVACALAVATRSNAFVLLPLFVIMPALLLYQRKIAPRDLLQFKCILCVLLLLGGLGVNSYRNLSMRINQGVEKPMLVGNKGKRDSVARAKYNDMKYFTTFMWEGYIKRPYRSFHKNGDRYYHWNSVLKTQLWSERKQRPVWLARWLQYGLLGMWLLLVIPVIAYRKVEIEKLVLPWSFLLLSLAGLTYIRLSHPWGSSSNFRYIYPAMIPFITIICTHVEMLRNTRVGWLVWPLCAAGAAFCVGSAYLLSQRFI